MVCFHSNRLHHLMARNKNAQNICLSYTVTVVHFTDQNWISKTVYCIRCVMVCKIGFTNWNAKIALLRASMVVTYYVKFFWTEADRHNGILMSLLLLDTETKVNMIAMGDHPYTSFYTSVFIRPDVFLFYLLHTFRAKTFNVRIKFIEGNVAFLIVQFCKKICYSF